MPYEFTDEDRKRAVERRRAKGQGEWKRYLALLESGTQPFAAARQAGISKERLKTYREDPIRVQEEVESEAIGAEPVEAALREAALGGNVQAAGKWLEKRSAQRWTPPAQEVHVRKETVVGLEAGPRLERIAKLLARLEGRIPVAELADPNVIDVEVAE